MQFSVASNGTLVYLPGGTTTGRHLAWLDRAGREEAIPAPPRTYYYPRLSPDGTRVALDVRDQENDVWIWDFARVTLTPQHRAASSSSRRVFSARPSQESCRRDAVSVASPASTSAP